MFSVKVRAAENQTWLTLREGLSQIVAERVAKAFECDGWAEVCVESQTRQSQRLQLVS